jgi:TolB protein
LPPALRLSSLRLLAVYGAVMAAVAFLLASDGSTARADASAVAARGARVAAERSDIYVVSVDGTHLTKLTHARDDTFFGWPAWAPSGTKIAFSGPPCEDCPDALYVARLGGMGARRLKTGVVPAAHPKWSPDGRRIAFVGGSEGAVYVFDLRTGTSQRLTRDHAAHDAPAWSPDGKQIAFSRQQRNGGWDLWLMNRDGTRELRLTRTKTSELHSAWSPNGEELAFARQRRDRWAIYAMGLSRRSAGRLMPGRASREMPTWSPDGSEIAFAQLGTRSAIYLMSAGGTRLRSLATISDSYSPAWSPDGLTIAFVGAGS